MPALRPTMFKEAEKAKTTSNLALQILIFIAVFAVIAIAEGIPSSILAFPSILAEFIKEGNSSAGFQESYEMTSSIMSDRSIMLPSLICTVFGTVISIIYCRFIECRPLSSMGVRKRKALPHYFQGLLTGLVLMCAAVGLTALSGAVDIRLCSDINAGIIAFYFFGWFLQGMSEEFIFRGYLMNSIGGKHSAIAALAVSSIIFAVSHGANPGLTPLALINLALFAVFAGLYMICFDDIWGVCAIHSVWNFAQGNLFGISVSGTGEVDSVLRTTAASSSVWLTGGKFGIEGSVFTTIVLTAASILVFIKIKKSSVQNNPQQ